MTNTGPIFLLTTHRSGGTLLSRLLNAHPDIVIWGEHGGLLNKLAEMAEIIRRHLALASPVTDRGLARYLDTKAVATNFSPWINPVDGSALNDFSRRLLDQWFNTGLRPGQVWGVKEIRYHSPETIRFILGIYPTARFIILKRNLADQCVSNIMATWSLLHIGLTGGGISEEEAIRVVDDCAYALTAINTGLDQIAKSYPAATMVVEYSKLVRGDIDVATLFEFVGFSMTADMAETVQRMLSVRSGETPKGKSQGFINRAFVEARAPISLEQAARQIELEGIDVARLRSRRGIGKYSFLVGDNEMRNSGNSTMF